MLLWTIIIKNYEGICKRYYLGMGLFFKENVDKKSSLLHQYFYVFVVIPNEVAVDVIL